MVGSPISMNRARDTVAAIGWLFLIMIASAAGAQYATSPTAISALGTFGAGSERSSIEARAQLGHSLGERLLGAIGNELIPIRVTLRHQDLPARGRGRREAIADRQDRILASPALSGRAVRRRYKEVAGFAMTVPAAAIGRARALPGARVFQLELVIPGAVRVDDGPQQRLLGVCMRRVTLRAISG